MNLSSEEINDNLILLFLSYQNLAVLNELTQNPTNALLYFQMSENIASMKSKYKIESNLSDPCEFIDKKYKEKLLSKIQLEKFQSLDKMGLHYRKM